MASIYAWSITAANNSSADGNINWAEGQAPSTVNNSARAMMGRVAELLGDLGGALTTGGTANGITVTANSSFTTYENGRMVAFKAGADNTGATTLNVNSIGAKAVRVLGSDGDAALAGGEIQEDGIFVVRYNSSLNSAAGGWQLINPAVFTESQFPTIFTSDIDIDAKLDVEDTLTIGPINVSSVTGLQFLDAGNIAAERSMHFYIDSDDDDSNRSFTWRHNAGSLTGSTELMNLDESGDLTLTSGGLTLSTLNSQILANNGNENSSPAYSFSGDVDTGLNRGGSGSVEVIGNGSVTATFAANGNLTIAGTLTENSDERLKTDWEFFDKSLLEQLANVKVGTYTRSGSGNRQIGVGAQSLANVIPEAVHENGDGYLSVAYGQAALVIAIELAKEVLEGRRAR